MQSKQRGLGGTCEPARRQSPHSTTATGSKPDAERPENINRSEGRQGRKVET
jgi:hypothetical protein